MIMSFVYDPLDEKYEPMRMWECEVKKHMQYAMIIAEIKVTFYDVIFQIIRFCIRWRIWTIEIKDQSHKRQLLRIAWLQLEVSPSFMIKKFTINFLTWFSGSMTFSALVEEIIIPEGETFRFLKINLMELI
jgi:hypothetical protein